MLTDDKQITMPEYWDKIYAGKNDNARVDASNTKRPAQSFDRFSWVAAQVVGPAVLGVASGHAHIEKRVKALHPDWFVVASDQATEAIKVSKHAPYWIVDAYQLPSPLDYPRYGQTKEKWDSVVIAQALEYLERPADFLDEARQVARYLVASLPLGEMEKWSQLRIYTKEEALAFFTDYGEVIFYEVQGDLLLVKVKF